MGIFSETMLHHSISEEYVPNQPIGSQFYLAESLADRSNDFLFTPGLLAMHGSLVTHEGQTSSWVPMPDRSEYDACLELSKPYFTNDNQVRASL